ncbi:MAG: hypothetical protein SH848_14110 [Saprospiraceae bacterium]|nr:hypothetical protein [Saprospiraceae bacterium]MDZ4705064.1 hypothetical protein [Saprospiraceae bacterium]
MSKEQKNPDCGEVIHQEHEAIKKRRKVLFGDAAAADLEETRFGIAMSGGGIRSATINMGFLRMLNQLGILKRADYLSTVSGGGYTGAYVHATLKGIGSKLESDERLKVDDYYKQLFSDDHISHLRSRGEYLIPGKGFIKTFNRLVLIIGYLSSLIMSLLSPALMVAIAASVYGLFSVFVEMDTQLFLWYFDNVLIAGAITLGAVLVIHYILNRAEIYGLNISLWFHRIETGILLLMIIAILATAIAAVGIQYSDQGQTILMYLGIGATAVALGFLVNPNASSFHRFYRGQLSEAFLKFAGSRKHQNILLKDLFPCDGKKIKIQDCLNPYPLINTCLNLQALNDPKFQGTKTNDYFLLSPLYCGAKLTGYVETKTHTGYSSMTLPAATTISAAALNPGMGVYSNKVLSVFLALFNARLGYWTWNPMKGRKGISIVWWPPYFFNELLSQIGTDKKMLNISDGGHIENLAVYELLRRKCRLIIAIDAGEDSKYEFTDLENLTIRARNELGIVIRFFEGQDPEDIIRPKASFGYSRKRFAVAGLYKIWEEFDLDMGTGKHQASREVAVLVNYRHDANAGDAPFDVFIKNEPNPDPAILELAQKQTWERYAQENPDKSGMEKLRLGTFVYVKSSVTAPAGKPNIAPPKEEKAPSILKQLISLFQKKQESPEKGTESLKYAVYKYKIYHPTFPHEPTSDQFFDEVQWEAYYQLGQHLADDVLKGLSTSTQTGDRADVGLNELIAHFEAAPSVPVPEEQAVTPVETTSRGLEMELPKAAEYVEEFPKQEDAYYKI